MAHKAKLAKQFDTMAMHGHHLYTTSVGLLVPGTEAPFHDHLEDKVGGGVRLSFFWQDVRRICNCKASGRICFLFEASVESAIECALKANEAMPRIQISW